MGIFKKCCTSTTDCSDRSVLPATLTHADGVFSITINRADWTLGAINGICCWSYVYNIQRQRGVFGLGYSQGSSLCSTEYSVDATYGTKLVSYRYYGVMQFTIAKGVSKCDAQPTGVNQYVLSLSHNYFGYYANILYYKPSPSCSNLVLSMGVEGSVFFQGIPFTQSISRTAYYASLATGSYILTSGSTSVCDDLCANSNHSGNTVTITTTTTGQSITWEDTNDWTVDMTY